MDEQITHEQAEEALNAILNLGGKAKVRDAATLKNYIDQQRAQMSRGVDDANAGRVAGDANITAAIPGLCECLSKAMGSGHVLESHRRRLERFWNDPNLNRAEELTAIESERNRIHAILVRVSGTLRVFADAAPLQPAAGREGWLTREQVQKAADDMESLDIKPGRMSCVSLCDMALAAIELDGALRELDGALLAVEQERDRWKREVEEHRETIECFKVHMVARSKSARAANTPTAKEQRHGE